MSEQRIKRTLEVAEHVSDIIAGNNEKCFVIGASALAAHGYSRQSVDLDLATHMHPQEVLPRLGNSIRESGFAVEVILPDSDDPLGGVINITGPDFDTVQVINFNNPWRRAAVHRLVGQALSELQMIPSELQVISAELLIVLKLYAGDLQSLSDIRKLLEANPDINLSQVTALSREAGLEKEWNAVRT